MAEEFDNNESKKYSTKQVADLLNIDKSTLLRWIRQGKIKDVTHRDGRNWRVWLQEDVAAVKEYHEMIHNLSLNLTFKEKGEAGKEDKPAEAPAGGEPEEKAGD